MQDKLWFVTDGVSLINVHNTKRDAEQEYNMYEGDPDFRYFDFYGIDIDMLDDYPDEYDLALERGFIR